jgi:phage baseplate assembly protein V
MQAIFDRMAQKMRSMVTRGRVMSAALNPKRPLVQLSGLAGEEKTQVELFMPMGMSVYPSGNEDLILLQVGGSRSHLVALFADNPALRITDLKAGEFGHRDTNGQQIVFRQDHLEITSPLKMQISVTGDVDITVGGKVTGKASSWKLTGDFTVDGTITGTQVQDDHASMSQDRSKYNVHKHGSSPGPEPQQ